MNDIKRFKLYQVLNILLSLIMFLNIYVYTKKLDFYFVFIVFSYIIVVILSNYINLKKLKLDPSFNLIINIFVLMSLGILYRINKVISFKQCIFFIAGYVIYMIISLYIKDINKLFKYKYVYFILTFIFMSMSYLFGEYINGSKNWISLFNITFQPSEFGKIFLILYLGCILNDSRSKKDKYLTLILLFSIVSFLILQRDLGTAVIIFILSMIMYYVKTSKYKFLLIMILSLFIFGILAYFRFYHVRVRINAWLNPEIDPTGISYQVMEGFFSMGFGGFLGRGLYYGDLEFIPVNYTDYIFVSIVEEFGVISGIFIVVLYFILFLRTVSMAYFIKGNKKITLVGFIILIVTQALIILGGILNLIPLTGVTLPFISYGGSSMIGLFIVFSLMVNMLKEEKDE